jgi:hypothetical protein
MLDAEKKSQSHITNPNANEAGTPKDTMLRKDRSVYVRGSSNDNRGLNKYLLRPKSVVVTSAIRIVSR